MALGARLFDFLPRPKLSTKLLTVIAILFVPIGILIFHHVRTLNKEIEFTNSELSGVDYLSALRQAMGVAAERRRLGATPQAGGRAGLAAVDAQLEKALQEIEGAEVRIGANPHTSKALEVVRKDWANLKARGGLGAQENFELHNALIKSLRDLHVEVCDFSKLTLDPEYTAYSLGALLNIMASDIDYLSRLQAYALRAAARGGQALPVQDRVDLAKTLGWLANNEEAEESAWEDIDSENKALAAEFGPTFSRWHDLRRDFVECVEKKAARSEAVDIQAQEVLSEGQALLDSTLGLYDNFLPKLRAELDNRVAAARLAINLSVGATVGGSLLSLLVVVLIIRSFLRQVQIIMDLFHKVSLGDFTARAEVATKDELGEMADTLNAVLEGTLSLLRGREKDRDDLQKSIVKLLDDVSGVAEGDLTKEAEVTADATGAIADSFNYMIGQLRQVIANVQDATQQVSSSATQIQSTAENLTGSSETQATQILNTAAAIDEMATSIQQVSENSTVSASVAEEARANAQKGAESVQNTIQGMNRIRDQVQETSKRIKRLGESSQQIGEIIQLIDDIADRTSILALNASIQAAMAGEAGRGFGVVAEEVERLAERSTDATKKIATLVKTIQGETNEAVTAMEECTREVVDGSKVANQAGKALHEIESVSDRLAELIQSISLASKQQARASEGVARSMNQISTVTQQTAAGTKLAAASVSQLASLADSLRSSVSAFKLPAASNGEGASLMGSVPSLNVGGLNVGGGSPLDSLHARGGKASPYDSMHSQGGNGANGGGNVSNYSVNLRRPSSTGDSVPPPPSAQSDDASATVFPCPTCGKALKGKEEWAGRHGKCPGCNNLFVFPHTAAQLAGAR